MGFHAGRVLLAIRHLLDRLTRPRARADDLLVLRRRLLAQQQHEVASPSLRELAGQLRELRERLATQLGHVDACARCGDPASRLWRGGQCCSAKTEALFGDTELAALRLAGTTSQRLRPPRGPQAGCAFRGTSGCSLVVADRPSVCVGYACRELLVELRKRGDAAEIARLQDELQHTFRRFAAERESMLAQGLFDELRAGVLASR